MSHFECRWVACFLFVLGLTSPGDAHEYEQILSREDPAFQCEKARFTIGKDGNLYFCSGGANSYVLRMSKEGKDPVGSKIVYAAINAIANAEGIIASSNAHFAHKVTLYDRSFQTIGESNEFLNNDQVGWSAPSYVDVGKSGDFYGADQHRDRILRISPTGKVLKGYAIPPDPAQKSSSFLEFRVCESIEAFYILDRSGKILCIGFDGKLRWYEKISVSRTDGVPQGGMDVDDSGNLFWIDTRKDQIHQISPEGKSIKTYSLDLKSPKIDLQKYGWSDLRIYGKEVWLKRPHPTELFHRFQLDTGKHLQTEHIRHERLAIEFQDRIWIAGKAIPLRFQHSGTGHLSSPFWKVWATSLGSVDYGEWKWDKDLVHVPADAAGIYQVKITPETQPIQQRDKSEYGIWFWVDVRQPNTTGSSTITTENHRREYARGEEVRLTVSVRSTANTANFPTTIQLLDDSRVIAEENHSLNRSNPFSFTLSSNLTQALRPGKYSLVAKSPGLSAVPSTIQFSNREKSSFWRMQYGDYGPTYPSAQGWEIPDIVSSHVARQQKIGINAVVDRWGIPMYMNDLRLNGRLEKPVDEIVKYLENQAGAPSPDRYFAPPLVKQVLSGYSALGIEQQSILMFNDAGLPLGTGFDPRKPTELLDAITKVTDSLKSYPSFRGWDWSSNWWVFNHRGSKAARTPQEKTAYETALKEAKETGKWNPILQEVSQFRLSFAVDAQEQFNKRLREIAPHLKTASACPHRNVESYPPISLSNVDEVDLQAQWEQVAVPYSVMHGVDFYKRPGKRAWTHPEVWNDSGTGDQILPNLFQAIMRGVDGIGCSGPIPPWTKIGGSTPDDPRGGHYGITSIFRSLFRMTKQYGNWFSSLENDDRVAIVVSGRMFRIDEWGHVFGSYFGRIFEAYMSCIHAHHPASIVFVEDLKPGLLDKYRAILIVGQRVEMEPELRNALESAKKNGTQLFFDTTSRTELVKGFTPLGIGFDQFEKDRHPASDDDAYRRFPKYCIAHVSTLKRHLDPIVPVSAKIDNPEVFVSQRKSGVGKFLFVVNNTTLDLEPGYLWRISLAIANRVPLKTKLEIPNHSGAIYDVFAGKPIQARNKQIEADLRSMPFRIFALLPNKIDRVELRTPKDTSPGQSIGWKVAIQATDRQPISTTIPIRVALFDSENHLLQEEFLVANQGIAEGLLRIPLNTRSGNHRLEVTELFGSTTSSVSLQVDESSTPTNFAGVALKKENSNEQSGQSISATWKANETDFGPHIRNLIVSSDGKTLFLPTMNWNHNLYSLDIETGKINKRQRIGQYFAFDPIAHQDGFGIQGFDFQSAEGYHLYSINNSGEVQRRFALYGLPRRQIQRFVPGLFTEDINHFAISPQGNWIASAGNLGLAVWSREGKLLWSQNWWKDSRKTLKLQALDDQTLLTVEGVQISAYNSKTGERLWQQSLASTGEATQIQNNSDGTTQIISTTVEGGTVFALRGEKIIARYPTASSSITITPDGSHFAVLVGNQLKLYSSQNGLLWAFGGDDSLHNAKFSLDGKRLAFSSSLGTLYVLDLRGSCLLEKDLGSWTCPNWLSTGDLVLGTWMGRVMRLDSQFSTKWETQLEPEEVDIRSKILAPDRTPTIRMTSWGNRDKISLTSSPNLLTPQTVSIQFQAKQPHYQFVHPPTNLVDGKLEPLSTPWLHWSDVSNFPEMSPINSIVLDTYRTQLRVKAITLVEDPKHPESWLREVKLEYWNPSKEQWILGQTLLSNSAIHSHRLEKPIEASRFRLVLPEGLCGNIRLAEIAFHGDKLGNSHPDVIAKKRLATLFDEGDDLRNSLVTNQLKFRFEGAYSGGRCLQLDKNGQAKPSFQQPFGHAVPNWDFEIVEKPKPGQYRYLQFAWKATSKETKGILLQIGENSFGNQVAILAGDVKVGEGTKVHPTSPIPPTEWKTVRIDLWNFFKKPIRVQTITFQVDGDGAMFDQILLGQTEKDFPKEKK